MITYAEILHYKSISEARISFSDINVVVGPNGSGKSNIIDAIYFLHDCAKDDIDTAITRRHGIDSIRQWSKTKPYNIVIEVKIRNDSGSGSYKLVISSQKGAYRIIEEQGVWYGVHPRQRHMRDPGERKYSYFARTADHNMVISPGFDDIENRSIHVPADELFLTSLAGRIPIPIYSIFKPISDELVSFSTYSIYPNTLRRPQIISKDPILLEDGSNLASVLKRINSGTRMRRNKESIIGALQQIMPIAEDFQIKSAGGYYVPVIRVEESNGDGHDFNLSQISDGTLRVLGLLAAFYQPNTPSKIAVEEPEQMIHPGALPIIAEAVRDFSASDERNQHQVFLTTHSPVLLDLFDPEKIIWARFKNGSTQAGRIRERQLGMIKHSLFSAGELMLAEGIF